MKQTRTNFWDRFAGKYDDFINRFAKDNYQTIERLLKEELQKNDKVLEIGTGTGIISLAIADNVREIIAIDSASEMIAVARNKTAGTGIGNVNFMLGNATETGFPENHFDVVVASNTFHLLQSPHLAIREIHRILKNSGKAILPTYCHGQNLKTRMISTIMGFSGFRAVNRWSVKSFRDFLESSRFVVLKEVIVKDKIPLSYIVLMKQK